MKHSPGFLALVAETKKRVREMTIPEYRERMVGQPHALIDVREDHEWAEGHLPGAIHIGRGILERDIEVRFPDKETAIVCYCGGGYRSALASDNLQRMGYRNVISLDGGFRGWREAGLPVETP